MFNSFGWWVLQNDFHSDVWMGYLCTFTYKEIGSFITLIKFTNKIQYFSCIIIIFREYNKFPLHHYFGNLIHYVLITAIFGPFQNVSVNVCNYNNKTIHHLKKRIRFDVVCIIIRTEVCNSSISWYGSYHAI